jgi:hypothetical protein
MPGAQENSLRIVLIGAVAVLLVAGGAAVFVRQQRHYATVAAIPLPAVYAPAVSLKLPSLMAWNVDSGDSSAVKIAEKLQHLGEHSIFCLSCVDPLDLETYRAALEAKFARRFDSINSASGADGRLQTIYDATRLEVLDSTQISEAGERLLTEEGPCCGLAARFKDLNTNVPFYVVNACFDKDDAALRTRQAIAIRKWTGEHAPSTAVIVIGDMKIESDLTTQTGNETFDELSRDGVLKWVMGPSRVADTHWHDADGDGKDDNPGTISDGACVAGTALDWNTSYWVVVRERDFPDDDTTSSHRPVLLFIWWCPPLQRFSVK